MEFNPEKPTSMINFKNQPKLYEHEIDQKFNERRLNLAPQIEQLLSTHELFAGKEVSVEFSHNGVSSLVSFIEVDGQKFVLKIPLKPIAEGEGKFLKEWEAAGVSVPHVFREGNLGDHPYILMSFIDAPILMDAIKDGSAKKDFSVEMGTILAMMHSIKAEGYGRIIEGKPEYEKFKEWITSEDIQKRISFVQENNLLTDEHGLISDVIDVLISYSEKSPESTYCHFDFGATNIMATEPLTVIDPDPMLNHGIIDIGRGILLEISGGHSGEQLKQGYFSDKEIDSSALQAAIVLNAYWKFPYWHKKNKTEQIESARRYLSQTRGNLKRG
jgi:fructosamine-3-kinase